MLFRNKLSYKRTYFIKAKITIIFILFTLCRLPMCHVIDRSNKIYKNMGKMNSGIQYL